MSITDALNQIINFLLNSNSLIKIGLFLIIWAVIWLPIAYPLARLMKWHPAAPISPTQKVTLIIPLYLIAPLLAWGVIKLGEQSLNQTKFILQPSLFQFILLGYVLGIITIAIIDGLEILTGFLKLESLGNLTISQWLTFPLLIIVSLLIASVEELIFRGLFVDFLWQDYSIWLTAIISSAIFALLHLIWERKNTLPQIPGLFLMGLVLYLARLVANNHLGLAIGIHGGWVFILGVLDTFDCYSYTDQSKGWIVGKKGQPLGSLAGISIVIIAGIILLFINRYIVI